jgi:citrate lyase subunit beta/citryl-CoA lyase
MLVASEDMVADLGAERSRGATELAYVRGRFLVECRAAGVEAIDCPYTFSDLKGAVAEAKAAKRLGYRMKSLVVPGHADALNAVFTISAAELKKARRIVAAFEAARAMGRDRVRVDGWLVEVPVYSAAKRLIERAAASGASDAHTPRRRQKKSR